MGLRIHWYLPTNGDSRDIVGSGDRSENQCEGLTRPFREADIDYLILLAKTADTLGYEAVLTPTGTWCHDAWITTAALSQHTKRLKFLVAFRPGFVSPVLCAHQAATFQRISGGRLLVNIVTGGDSLEQRRYGDHLAHDERYLRTEEFLRVFRGVSTATSRHPWSFEGRYYDIDDARIDFDPWLVPPIFFGGASPIAEQVAARQADVYLAWGETPAQIHDRVQRVGKLAADAGCSIKFGVRFHVITRDTSRDAWETAAELVRRIDQNRIAEAQAALAQSESVGQQRMVALHQGRTDSLEVYPNVWAGFGLVRGGAGTAIVGGHEEVAERIEEYASLGVEHFILSGQPHVEEAYWFAEGVLPILRKRGLVDPEPARAPA